MENSTISSNVFSVFISRELHKESPLRTQRWNVSWTDIPMIGFEQVPFDLPKDTKRVFFYSRKGVSFFFERLKQSSSDERLDKLIYYCMGRGTERELERVGYRSSWTGKGDAENCAEWLLEEDRLDGLLFVKAKISRSSVEHALENRGRHAANFVEVYQQLENPKMVQQQDVYIFTSPLNFTTFMRVNAIEPDAILIAIGPTTKGCMTSYLDGHTVKMAQQPSEESINALLQRIFEELIDPKNSKITS